MCVRVFVCVFGECLHVCVCWCQRSSSPHPVQEREEGHSKGDIECVRLCWCVLSVCVCVCLRERKGDIECVRLCVCVGVFCLCVCVCVCVCVFVGVNCPFLLTLLVRESEEGRQSVCGCVGVCDCGCGCGCVWVWVCLLVGATISRLLGMTGLFRKRALLKRRYSAKETYYLKEPTNRSHHIPC